MFELRIYHRAISCISGSRKIRRPISGFGQI